MKTFYPSEFSTRCQYCDSDRIRTTPAPTLLRPICRGGRLVAAPLYTVQHFACSTCGRAWDEAVEQW